MKLILIPTFKLNISNHNITLPLKKSQKSVLAKYNRSMKKFIMSKFARITKTSMFNILLKSPNLKKSSKQFMHPSHTTNNNKLKKNLKCPLTK